MWDRGGNLVEYNNALVKLNNQFNVYKTAVCAMRSGLCSLKDTEAAILLQVIEVMVFSKKQNITSA